MPTPSEHALADFVGLRDSLRHARIGDGGRDLCDALTGALDTAIDAGAWDDDAPLAVVALGGYGRRELSPHSDIDLMLLHRLEDPSAEAARLFRPLWDAGLRVGHAVRTVAEAGAAARERFDTQTTLLTARLVAGDASLFEEMMARLAAVTRARPLRRHLVAEERERRRKSPYLEMAPDLKNGRGGLRTLQGLEWERRREGLIGRFTAQPTSEEAAAAEILLRARNALHVVSGRPNDVLSPELRDGVARWLDAEHRKTTQQVIDAMYQVDRLAARHWPEALDDRAPSRQRSTPRIRRRPASRRTELSTSFAELIGALETGDPDALEHLSEGGTPTELERAWESVRSRAQLEPFHQHPVGDHLWRTVGEMRRLIADSGHYGRVAAEVDSPETLLLGAFLHDIGKGQGGDHSEIGAAIAVAVCSRLGVPAEMTAVVEQVVRHHLLLALTATRRDLDDPAVIEEVAGLVGDLKTLQAVYLLTVADSIATSASMWSPWKATLLRTLFTRCAARFGADRARPDRGDRDELVAKAASDMRETVRAYLAVMPDQYVRAHDIEDVLWHLELLSSAHGSCVVGVRAGPTVETAVVVGPTGKDTRLRVGEALAAHGIDVVEARLATQADGAMVDTFRVRDDRTGGPVPPERWERVRHQLAGTDDEGASLAARIASYPAPPPGAVIPEARAARDPATGALVVTVKCSDRIGRLAEILGVLAELGLEVRLAKLESRGIEVVDTFHLDGGAIPDEALDGLGDRIAAMIPA